MRRRRSRWAVSCAPDRYMRNPVHLSDHIRQGSLRPSRLSDHIHSSRPLVNTERIASGSLTDTETRRKNSFNWRRAHPLPCKLSPTPRTKTETETEPG
jgi:hypothetical protein